jgi:hypothetical protein
MSELVLESVALRRRVALPWIALLAGPLSFGITAPALVLDDIAAALGTSAGSTATLVTVFAWGIAVGSPLAGRALARHGRRTTLVMSSALVVVLSYVAGRDAAEVTSRLRCLPRTPTDSSSRACCRVHLHRSSGTSSRRNHSRDGSSSRASRPRSTSSASRHGRVTPSHFQPDVSRRGRGRP